MELDAVLGLSGPELEDKGLVQIAQERDGSLAREVFLALAHPASAAVSHGGELGVQACRDSTYDRNVDFPTPASPNSRIVTVFGSMNATESCESSQVPRDGPSPDLNSASHRQDPAGPIDKSLRHTFP